MHRALTAYVRSVWHQPASPAARLAMIILTRRACSSASSLLRTLERRLALLGVGATDDVQLQLPLCLSANDDDEPGAEVGAPGLESADSERRALEALIALALARQCRTAAGRKQVPSRSPASSVARSNRRSSSRNTGTRSRRSSEYLRSFETCQLHGGLTTAERADAIREFTTGDRSVLLATDAASEGLNLHHRCRLVVHLEVPWTPTRIEQRVGRVDRIGQSRTVHQVHPGRGRTVEESRVARVIRRMSNVASALSAFSRHTVDELQCAAHVIGNETCSGCSSLGSASGRCDSPLICGNELRTKRLGCAAARQLLPTCGEAKRGRIFDHLSQRRGGRPEARRGGRSGSSSQTRRVSSFGKR